MEKFNVIIYDPNKKSFESYNVIPYFVEEYKDLTKKPKTFKEFKDFVKKMSLYQFWARCQYEIILQDWPCQEKSKKIDIYYQIMMNLDVVTRLVMKSI